MDRALWNNVAAQAFLGVQLVRYEFPFNESIRTMLRLERLFDRLSTLIPRTEPIDHHFALVTIFEIMDVASRADLKSDLLKELEKQRATLNGYRGNPAVSESMLDEIVGRIESAYQGLIALSGKAGHSLLANDWLMGIRSRISIPGGTCEFDLPAYYAWQQWPAERRSENLQQWASTLSPLAVALRLLMGLLRDSGHPQMVAAPGGQFQKTLSQHRSYQLLQVHVPADSGMVPEITGHRFIVAVRMMSADSEGKLKALGHDCHFQLTLCH